MKAIKFLLICMVAVVMASCAGLNTTPYLTSPVETKVIVKEGNFDIVKEVEGEWSAVYVFGIGGLKKAALETNAISEMYKNAKLTGSQQIINITTTISTKSILGIYTKRYVKAHGYVVQFK
ncbi:MAG: hypothetical protein IKY49_03265 [Paludibacteraceae bacterium]|nr:hypothetical protein [Paludibacteraceae bacterium]